MSYCTNASLAPLNTVTPPTSARRLMLDVPIDRLPEDPVEPGDHVDAGHDHGGGVDEGGHRRGAGHGVGEPGVQDELARLRHDGGDQRARRHQQSQVADVAIQRLGVDVEDVEGLACSKEQDDHAHDQPDVADAVGDERLEGGVAVGLLLPPVADEHEGADADQLPADHELQGAARHDQTQHRRGEQRQERGRRCSGDRRPRSRSSRRGPAARPP